MTINSIPALSLLFTFATAPAQFPDVKPILSHSILIQAEEEETSEWTSCETFILNNAFSVPPETLALLQTDFANGTANWTMWLSTDSSLPGGGIGFPDSPPIMFDNASDVITAAVLLLQNSQ
ncbi:hypothetical protein C0431_03835 [bacterium]|nr:hypothetical protein [bacterium]